MLLLLSFFGQHSDYSFSSCCCYCSRNNLCGAAGFAQDMHNNPTGFGRRWGRGAVTEGEHNIILSCFCTAFRHIILFRAQFSGYLVLHKLVIHCCHFHFFFPFAHSCWSYSVHLCISGYSFTSHTNATTDGQANNRTFFCTKHKLVLFHLRWFCSPLFKNLIHRAWVFVLCW